MKYLYWLIGLVLLVGVGAGAYYARRASTGVAGNSVNNVTAPVNSQSTFLGINLPSLGELGLFSKDTSTSSTANLDKTYTNSKYGYAFNYPAGYHLDLTFANNGYSERGGSGSLVGGDIEVSSESFPKQTEEPGFWDNFSWISVPTGYTGFSLRVVKSANNATIAQAITSASGFIDYDKDVLTSREYKTSSGVTGLIRMYKVIYYDQLGPEKGDLPMTPEEYNAMEDFNVKYAPTYFFKVGDKLVVIDTYGKSRSVIEAMVSTFKFI